MLRNSYNFIRRLVAAVLVVVGLVCVAEVALRSREYRTEREVQIDSIRPLPALPSRVTRFESPAVWKKMLTHPVTGEPFQSRTNSLGLRGPEPTILKPPGTLRILCLGDDTTLAPLLPESECYPAVLERLLEERVQRPVEVINAGMPGGYPLTEWIKCKQSLLALQPDVILWHIDLSDAIEELEARRTVRVDAFDEPVAVVHESFDLEPAPGREWTDQFAILRYLRGETLQRLSPPLRRSRFEAYQARLEAWAPAGGPASELTTHPVATPVRLLANAVEHRPTEIMLTYCPSAWQASELLQAAQDDAGRLRQRANERPAQVVSQAANERNVYFLDATRRFLEDESPQELFSRETGRLSPRGHKLYAQVIADGLLKSESRESAAQQAAALP
ncbi:MAG: hypothetical protein R3B90_13155 [Planctomycetaceae bacterium]